MDFIVRIARMPDSECRQLLNNSIDDFAEREPLYRENGQFDRIQAYKEQIEGFRHFGNYFLEFPEKNRNGYGKMLHRMVKKIGDPQLKGINSTLNDLTGAGANLPDRLGLTVWQRRALLERDGEKVEIDWEGQKKDLKIVVKADPLVFTPGEKWASLRKYLPLVAAFIPYPLGPTNDSATQSALGRIGQIVLGLCLSPFIIVGSILFFLAGGPLWCGEEEPGELHPLPPPYVEPSDDPPPAYQERMVQA